MLPRGAPGGLGGQKNEKLVVTNLADSPEKKENSLLLLFDVHTKCFLARTFVS